MEALYGPIDPLPPPPRAILPRFRAAARKSAKSSAAAAPPPLPVIPGADMLLPGSPGYDEALIASELREIVPPQIRAMCSAESAVAAVVDWLREQGLPFAVRCGGHSYAGLSQSASVVVDVRRMNAIAVDQAQRIVKVGAGAALGAIYRSLAGTGLGFAGGSCPTVGVAGHVLGGGMGLLGRAHGLACDNLLSLTMIDASGAKLVVDAANNSDLFWACRGGGGGSFGIATEFTFRLHPVPSVFTFGVTWTLPKAAAVALFDAWQGWGPTTLPEITALMKVQGLRDGRIKLRCVGQSTGSEATLRRELATLTAVADPDAPAGVKQRSFIEAVEYFAGSWEYQSIYHKGMSDFVSDLSIAGIEALLDQLIDTAAINLAALCDPYGGAIADLAPNATAFPFRGPKIYCIQYYLQWSAASQTAARLQACRAFYAALRPFMRGGAYVNYCDTDLADWATAYWGANLPRLRRIKAARDPGNLFRHRQSVAP
ncbi:MAG TPA: FAD-binding oxidoreductase [Allosphingosinicella sp.]|nr:FAD-binding oxidoreductase [Allosphingosinicella sp.]